MAKRTLPGLGLTGFWPAGTNDWGDENDANLLLLSAITQGSVTSRSSALPGSPTQGMRYIVQDTDPTNPNKIAVRDNGAWVYFAPLVGWSIYVTDESSYVRYNGSAWVSATGVVPITLEEELADYVLTDSDLAGNVIKKLNQAGANTVTVNSGLTGTEPVMLVQQGLGQTTVVAGSGVTIRSADAALKLRTRYSGATLIPDGADTYLLVGDITT